MRTRHRRKFISSRYSGIPHNYVSNVSYGTGIIDELGHQHRSPFPPGSETARPTVPSARTRDSDSSQYRTIQLEEKPLLATQRTVIRSHHKKSSTRTGTSTVSPILVGGGDPCRIAIVCRFRSHSHVLSFGIKALDSAAWGVWMLLEYCVVLWLSRLR
ncbi:unnamed protein product [Tuber aestivum]|uniref:Uncharacterized protein n=1 Tax=Tuber aestivum TaxID=59557 RepID=A0A292Q7Y9_9PEZI|nr:unnamed protein product [Tuber aestivum]